MIRSVVILILLVVNWEFSYSQKSIRFEQLEGLQKAEAKNTLIFIHTDWCSVCQGMKSRTFADKHVQDYIDSNFYFISLNGEEKKDIVFKDHLFKFQSNGQNTGIHQLAFELGAIEGKLSYPSIVILNPKDEIIVQYSGYLSKEELQLILKQAN